MDQDHLPDLEVFSTKIAPHVCRPITRPLLVAKEAMGIQLATVSAKVVKTQGQASDKLGKEEGDLPPMDTSRGPQWSTRSRKPVEKLVVLHAPTHKWALPKWKADKLRKAEEALTRRKTRAAVKGNNKPTKEDTNAGTMESEGNKTIESQIEQKEDAYTPFMVEESASGPEQTIKPTLKVFYNPTLGTLEEIKGLYEQDKFYKFILENLLHSKKFEVVDSLIYIKESKGKALCIPDVEINKQKLHKLVIRDAHVQIRHGGAKQTSYALCGKFWWRNMVMDMQEYCSSCHICATMKHQMQSKMGLLTLLDPTKEPWECIQINFVGPLPESENLNGKWDMLCVIINQATSMICLVPMRQTYKAHNIVEVIFNEVWKLHGLPRAIVSDCNKLFDS